MMIALFFTGCVHVNGLSVTAIPAERGTVVSATAESKLAVLGIGLDQEWMDNLVNDLRAQCEGGVVSGILTKDEQISYVVADRRRVTATGYCVR